MRSPSRFVRALFATVALVVALLLGTGTLAPAATTTPTTLTIKAPTMITTGAKAALSGKLVDAKNKPVPNATVIIRWRKPGTTAWPYSTSVITTSKGTWSTKIRFTLNTQLRAEYAGGAATAASTSPVVVITAQQVVTITRLSPTRPAIGQVLKVSGTASPYLRGRTLTLQRRTNGVWSIVATTKITSTGTFSTGLRVTNANALTLRVRTSSGTKAITRATSPTRYVYVAVTATLYAGGKLGARRVLSSPNGLYTATMGIDGNLVVRTSAGTRLWRSGTSGQGLALRLSTSGNLTIGTASKISWSSGTAGATPRLVLQNDGSLVVFSKGKSLWSSTLGLGGKVAPAVCRSVSFDCLTFSSYVPSISYWRMYAGHNCTNYVAYRMIMKGVQDAPWGYPGGSAWQWRAGAKKAKIKVDTTPAVGAVMQWGRNTNGGGSSGHVVYVEKVTATSVTISEDSWSGYGAVRVIRKDSSNYKAAKFIHIKDALS